MPDYFQIESAAVPLLWTNYFTTTVPQFQTVSTETLLNRIVGLGANDVRLLGSYGELTSFSGNTYAPFVPQSLESLKTFTDAAHARGLAITWNPISHINGVVAGDPNQPSHLSPSNIDAWFQSFRATVLENARTAQAIGADRYMVFTDVEQFVFQDHPELTDRMVTLMGEIRQVYSGQLSTVIYTPDGQVTRFPEAIIRAVDLIGLGLFPVLTTKTDPTLAELKAAWHADVNGADIIANLARLAAEFGKQIWLSDFAQSSYDGWLRESPNKFDANATFVVDNGEQALGYQAALSELLKGGGSWFAGLSAQNISRIENDNGLLPKYLSSAVGENFFGKPAQDILTAYFTGTAALETNEVRGTNYGEVVQGGYALNVLRAGQANQTLNGGAADDLIYSSAPAQNVAAHELRLTVAGNTQNGVAPTFEVRINGKVVPLTFTASAPLGSSTVLSVPIYEAGPITRVEIVATNWIFAPGGVNRFVRFTQTTLDGVNLRALPTTYRTDNGGAATFTGDTNQGGIVAFDTSGATLTAPLRVTFASNLSIEGGAGRDTVAYDGAAAAFALSQTGANVWTVQKPGAPAGQGLDTLSNIEVLLFADTSVWIAGSFNMADQTGAVRLDLRSGATSDVRVAGQSVSVVAGSDLADANGGAGADSIVGNAAANRVFGGGGHDTVDGGGGTNYLRGDEGDDSLIGGAGFNDINGNMGNDTVNAGSGDSWAVGGKDNDSLAGGTGQNLVYGNLGNDTCDGGDGDDIVRGGQENDVVRGGAGNDFVSGDKGDDTMTGGTGADNFHTFGDAGLDRVTDFSLAQGDRVQLDPGTVFTVAQVGADTVISMTGGGQMILVGVAMSSLTGNWIFGA